MGKKCVMSLAIPGIPPEVIPFGIMTNICTDEPKNADVRTISVSLKNLPVLVLGDLNIIALCLRSPVHLITVAAKWCSRNKYHKIESELAKSVIFREDPDAQ